MTSPTERFTECWHSDGPRVLAYASRHVGRDLAHDVVADTFMVAWRRWDEVPAEHIADGIERQMIVGEKLMVCRLRFRPHVETAVHSHPQPV